MPGNPKRKDTVEIPMKEGTSLDGIISYLTAQHERRSPREGQAPRRGCRFQLFMMREFLGEAFSFFMIRIGLTLGRTKPTFSRNSEKTPAVGHSSRTRKTLA
jgi:hypothetical protein